MALAVINPGKFHKGYSFERPPFNNAIYDPLQIAEIRAKTAVVVNRRTYVGNVKVFYSDGSSEVLSDAMFKSEVGKFDKFKRSGRIDVAVDDGEHIVALAEYADRILQFKQRTLHVLNVSQEVEYLEDSHMYKGIDNRAAVCKTDYGCAWVNEMGCYMYDGKQIRNILDKKGIRRIKSSTWSAFITQYAAIGYIPKERQLLVIGNMGDGSAGYFESGGDGFSGASGLVNAYLYDLVTDSWIFMKQRIYLDNGMSNMVVDFNNDLIYGYDVDAGEIKIGEWQPVPSSSATVLNTVKIVTKDFDFGDAGRDTFIYKVIIQYIGGGNDTTADPDQDMTVYYRTNGDQGDWETFNATTKLDDTTGNAVTVEIKPDSTIKNKKSFQLKLEGEASNTFVLNDITIIYREKSIG